MTDFIKVARHGAIKHEDVYYLIGDFCLITVPELRIGSHSQINAGSKVLGRETVTIGRHTVISYDCLLLTSSDSPDPPIRLHDDLSPENERKIRSAPITIGDFCYIGAKCIIMPGVVIPDNTVIPAMSYVDMKNKRLKAYSVKATNATFKALAEANEEVNQQLQKALDGLQETIKPRKRKKKEDDSWKTSPMYR